MAILMDNHQHAVSKTGLENYLCFLTILMMFHYIYSFVIFSSTAIKESTSSDNLTHKKNGLEPSASCWDSSSQKLVFL